MSFIKKTLLNGFFLLIPISIVGFLLYKIIMVLRLIAHPISKHYSFKFFGMDVLTDFIIAILFLIVCFIVGLLANRKRVRHFSKYLEDTILSKIPGYIFFKGITDGIATSKKSPENFKPVLVEFDDNAQMGFKIESLKTGEDVIYFPGSPVPWSGSIMYVDSKRVRLLDTSVSEALKHLQRLGKNSDKLVVSK
ncbi:DUF502 domain-containing protein [Winogradskyella aurantia]|nr:DUF502 domain-containing protein [Winogradskyella aurantia]